MLALTLFEYPVISYASVSKVVSTGVVPVTCVTFSFPKSDLEGVISEPVYAGL